MRRQKQPEINYDEILTAEDQLPDGVLIGDKEKERSWVKEAKALANKKPVKE